MITKQVVLFYRKPPAFTSKILSSFWTVGQSTDVIDRKRDSRKLEDGIRGNEKVFICLAAKLGLRKVARVEKK